MREVPIPAAPTQSLAVVATNGAPAVVAFPHWVTARNTPEAVGELVVTLT